ncbi:MAG: glycosyltransferase family 2 protein [Bacteroidota bacterium]
MKIAGFSFVRNAIQYDYPIVEAITSILPICDEFVVAVGQSDDNTLELIRSIQSDKIKIIETIWDDHLRKGGQVLAIETDKALAAVSPDADWAFYIQGDEVVHERYLDNIHKAAQQYKDNPEVEGLLFNYLHFYGSYQYIADSLKWYRREIRMIRKKAEVVSYKDAQGFRTKDNQKLRVKLIDAYIYHYGWVKEPQKQQKKQETFHQYWHDDATLEKMVIKAEEFDYSGIDSLALFDGTHPAVMQIRVENENWPFDHNLSHKKLSFKEKIRLQIDQTFGWRIGEYKNYKLL